MQLYKKSMILDIFKPNFNNKILLNILSNKFNMEQFVIIVKIVLIELTWLKVFMVEEYYIKS